MAQYNIIRTKNKADLSNFCEEEAVCWGKVIDYQIRTWPHACRGVI
jgi:hypothetical protein